MTDIDTSKWPKPGETWISLDGRKFGPLRLTKTGMLTNGHEVWTPNGSDYSDGSKSNYDLISKVEPKPEPVEFWVNEYGVSSKSLRNLVERQSCYETLQEAIDGAANTIIRHHRIRVEVIETVGAKP